VSADTIRHYERLGLVKRPARTRAGYRDYPPESLYRVRLIRRALAVGFSFKELAAILGVRDRGGIPCRSVLLVGAQKRKDLDQRIRELHGLRRQLDSILKDWRKRLARTRKGEPARLLESLSEGMEEGNHALNRSFALVSINRRSARHSKTGGQERV
jgi:MerR family mercuric resistance operon transcriptional regulator